MKLKILFGSAAVIAIASALAPAASQQLPAAQISTQQAFPAAAITGKSIGGIVTGTKGPEAGVWVIAITKDLPTPYAKIVVTDESGRYVLPDLPHANYDIFVRGYGLVDSPMVKAAPGKRLDLKSVQAPSAAAAAQYYPGLYWFSLLKIPDEKLFEAGTRSPDIVKTMLSQNQWLNTLKSNGCVGCHEMGELATRTIPKELGTFENEHEAWERRIQSGQSSANMIRLLDQFGVDLLLKNFADWTQGIREGALPTAKPSRPQGIERNIVITEWDWSDGEKYMHDEVATDKRDPTRNGYGLIYGSSELSSDDIPVLDPVKNTTWFIHEPVLDPSTPSSKDENPQYADSPYWGDKLIWDSKSIIHNPMFDDRGRVWFTARIRPPKNPPFCLAGSSQPSAKLFPIAINDNAGVNDRQLSFYDPKTKKFTLVDTCFGSMHLQFGFDADDTLWLAGDNTTLGWVDTKKFDETGDAVASQGWTPFIVDTMATGKRDENTKWTEPGQPLEPGKDARVLTGLYGIAPDPTNKRIIWGSLQQTNDTGAFVRVDLGDNPPATALTEIYRMPAPYYGVRGFDIDSQGVVWAGMTTGQLASFDRRKCKGPLNGPDAIKGQMCPEGWSFWRFPGPNFVGLSDKGSAESSYYTWVDQHNAAGLGKDVPIATGNENESLLALVKGKIVNMRIPYPLGFYAKNLDGRIDDPKAGWKGRGLWTTTGSRTPQHMETGKGTPPKLFHIQFRPNPLAG